MKVCVLGLGYVGLPTATILATCGFKVTGVDVDPEIVQRTNSGETTIKEPGFSFLLEAALKSHNLKAVSELPEADCFIICVPTPFSREDKSKTLEHVRAAASSVASKLHKENIVILESTVPPGTTEHVLKNILEESGLTAGKDFYLAYCPERLLPGRLLYELVNNDRIVGGINEPSSKKAKTIYERFVDGKIFLTDATTAEFIKLMENTYGAVNIALANEFAKVSEVLGVDVNDAIKLANRHPRTNIYRPGPGTGGHCIPIDPWFLVGKASESTPLIRSALEVNERMPFHVVSALEEALKRTGKSMKGAKIAVLGLAYKGEVGDSRNSPSIAIIELLQKNGADVKVHDPFVETYSLPIERDIVKTAIDADALLILTDHAIYVKLESLLPEIRTKMKEKPILIDARNVLRKADGFIFWKLGVGFVE